MPRAAFDAQRGATGALLVGSPEEVAEKICRHSESLGGLEGLLRPEDSILVLIDHGPISSGNC
ncbi:MAG: hypothetical protein KME43_25505 [Myxacorys chilensis ATA2-1-KO14]|nr:hypothetical protein [Myxacorys chilensis ATA2-1-KO14]